MSTSADRSLANLVYLYCIVEPATAAHQLLRERRVPGLIDAEPLFPVEAGRLVGAASYVPAASFQEEPLNALVGDLKRLTPYAIRHQAAIGALFDSSAASIPLGFGAVYLSVERVASALREHAGEFSQMLDRVRDRQEWGVRATADGDLLRQHASVASEEIRRLTGDIPAAARRRAYLLGKQRERLVDSEADRLAGEAVIQILASLAAVSDEVRQDNLPASPAAARQRLVLKAEFLVKAARAEDFRVTALALARTYAPRGLAIDLTGPWAPYSFVSTASLGRPL